MHFIVSLSAFQGHFIIELIVIISLPFCILICTGVHIGDTLKQLAERRSDIFGVSAEETLIGRKLGEEETATKKKQTTEIWDGHTASIERATKLAHSNITYEDQIKAIHKAKGLL